MPFGIRIDYGDGMGCYNMPEMQMVISIGKVTVVSGVSDVLGDSMKGVRHVHCVESIFK
jgi:hypothetical protein